MGLMRNIILPNRSEIRREVREQNGVKWIMYEGEVCAVELDHEYEGSYNHKHIIQVYKLGEPFTLKEDVLVKYACTTCEYAYNEVMALPFSPGYDCVSCGGEGTLYITEVSS
jgi:hypothetical protein